MTLYFTAEDGRRLAYQDSHGAGPVVLCLAGLTRNARDFAALSAHLSVLPQCYRVLRLDSRGRGMSAWAADPLAEYTVLVEARDALALLDHVEAPRAAIIGTSRGGILGMVLGATARDRVICLVLNDVGPVVEAKGMETIIAYLGVEPSARTFQEAAEAMARTMGAAFPDLTPAQWLGFARTIFRDEDGRPRNSYDNRLRDAVVPVLENGPPELWQMFDALEGLPILTLRGENSDIFSAETLAEMARRRPDMAQAIIPRRGHVPFLDEAESLTAIEAFLERHAT